VDSFEENLKKVVTTSIGAIISTVEKSRDAIMEFARSEKANEFSQKGEEVLQSVLDAGGQAVNKVREAVAAVDENEKARREKARLVDLAYKLHSLDASKREELDRLLDDLKKAKTPPTKVGTDMTDDGIGNPGVTESGFDRNTTLAGMPGCKKPGNRDPLASATPTSPDDDQNVRRSQTNNMNVHLKQDVPPPD
jgi:hypothetical protein